MCAGNPVGSIFSMLGTFNQIQAQTNESNYKINELTENANIAHAAEVDAVARGHIEAGKVRLKGQQLAGEQMVAFAANGVDPTQGTAADVQAGTAAMNELDAQTVENNAAREAWGYGKQREKFQREIPLERQRQTSQNWATLVGGGAKFIGGAGG